MKLKKIASLALVGAMAVSMLAGCAGGKGNDNGANGGNDDVTVTPTSVVKAVNDGQSPLNIVKVNFTTDSKLETALQRAVSTLGVRATEEQIKAAVANITGLKTEGPGDEWSTYSDTVLADGDFNGFLGGGVIYATDHSTGEDIGDEDGKTYTLYNVVKLSSVTTETFALNIVAQAADAAIAQLAKTSNDGNLDGKVDDDGTLEVEIDGKYYSYSYEGNISMVSVANPEGTTDYYVAYVLSQTIAEKTLD